jgi:hypothetical protein
LGTWGGLPYKRGTAYAKSTKEGVSGEPWCLWTSYFTQSFIYVRTLICQSFTFIVHHRAQKFIFTSSPHHPSQGGAVPYPPKYIQPYGEGALEPIDKIDAVEGTVLLWDFIFCVFQFGSAPCSWEINFNVFQWLPLIRRVPYNQNYIGGSIQGTVMSLDFIFCTKFELYKALDLPKFQLGNALWSWEINFYAFPYWTPI